MHVFHWSFVENSFDSYEASQLIDRETHNYEDYIYKTAHPINQSRACIAMCNIHEDKCHFIIYSSSTSTCYFGSFIAADPISATLSDTSIFAEIIMGKNLQHKCITYVFTLPTFDLLSGNVNDDDVATAAFTSSIIDGEVWPKQIFHEMEGGSEDECASYCLLWSDMDLVCDMFLFNGSHCALGNRVHYNAQAPEHTSSGTVFMKIGKIR